MTAENLKSRLEYQKEWASQCTRSSVQHCTSQHGHRCVVARLAAQPTQCVSPLGLLPHPQWGHILAGSGFTQTLCSTWQVGGCCLVIVLLDFNRLFFRKFAKLLTDFICSLLYLRHPSAMNCTTDHPKILFPFAWILLLNDFTEYLSCLYSEKSLIIFLYEASLWHCWLDVSLLNLKHLSF